MFSENIFFIIYWFHFMIFILSQFKVFSFLEGTMTLVYPIIYFIILLFLKEQKKIVFLMVLLVLEIILSVYYNMYIQNFIIYYLFFFLVNRKIRIKFSYLLNILNRTLIIYFLITLIFNYFLQGKYSVYIIRNLSGKIISNIDRFIGIEGTPAGPDILSTLVLIACLLWANKNKVVNCFRVIFSFAVIIWCSSFSNVAAIILSLPVFITKSKKIIIGYILFITILFHKLIAGLFFYTTFSGKKILNTLTTFRASIWSQILNKYNESLSGVEKFIGSKKLVEFIHFNGELNDNPHNTFLLLEIKSGYIFTYLVYFYILSRIFKLLELKDIKKVFVILIILIYATSNSTILTARGNPIIIYILYYILNNNFKEE